MLREIIRDAATTSPDIDIVDERPGPLVECVVAMTVPPDVVIADADQTREEEVFGLLARYCHLRVLRLTADAAHVTRYEMRPHRSAFGELAAETLLALVRGSEEI